MTRHQVNGSFGELVLPDEMISIDPHPAAPVIRLVVTIYDQPNTPLAVETFFNVADEVQRADYAALATQEQLVMLFYDEALTHQLTKVVPCQNLEAAQVLDTAEQLLKFIPQEEFDFDKAKATITVATGL